MDTNELSVEAYNGVILEAENFHHDLTAKFEIIAGGCDDEAVYLEECIKLINWYLSEWDPEELLADIFYEEPKTYEDLKDCLKRIQANIAAVKKIPYEVRRFEE